MSMGQNLQNNFNKLDNLNINKSNENIDLNKREIKENLLNFELKRLYKYAQHYQGNFMPKKVIFQDNSKNSFKFQCSNNHKFDLSILDIENNKWCKTCENKFNKLEEIVRKRKATIINKNILTNNCILKCKFNHIFKIDISNLNKIKWQWCKECLNKKENIRIKEQEELFKNINNKYSEHSRSSSSKKEENFSTKEVEALNFCNGNILKSIGIDIKNKSNEILGSEDLSIEKRKEKWWIIFMRLSSSLVRNYLHDFDDQWKKDLFRTCCLLLHPDKNSNIASKEAFIKLLSCFRKN